MRCYSVFFTMLLTLPVSAMAERFESPRNAPAVIELFTSEGCSSCPPAERWLNRFADSDGLWVRYFPLAWHVDYWDSLGWPDRFADARYSQRQRRYHSQTPLRSVYTPGVLVNGSAWRGWVIGAKPGMGSSRDIGRLRVDTDGSRIHAQLLTDQSGNETDYLLQVAVLGFGLTTEVKRGENAGKTLSHEFVVLASETLGRNRRNWIGELPEITQDTGKLAIMFWLEKNDSPVPLQVAGGWFKYERH